MEMNFIAKYAFLGLVVFSLSACVDRPENEMVQEMERQEYNSGIDLTNQMDGTFIGFANEEKKEVTIEVEGEEKTYLLAEDATGDFNVLMAGDAIAFSTKTKDGEELIETLWTK